MKFVERVCLYALIAFVAVHLIDGARADDEEKAPEALTAREINIENADGKVVLRLSANDNGGGRVQIYAKNGAEVARLAAGATGGHARYSDNGEKSVAYVGADPGTGTGYVAVRGKEKSGVSLFVHEYGGVVHTNRSNGKPSVSLGSGIDDGSGYMFISDRNDDPALAFITAPAPTISVVSNDGKPFYRKRRRHAQPHTALLPEHAHRAHRRQSPKPAQGNGSDRLKR